MVAGRPIWDALGNVVTAIAATTTEAASSVSVTTSRTNSLWAWRGDVLRFRVSLAIAASVAMAVGLTATRSYGIHVPLLTWLFAVGLLSGLQSPGST